MTIIASNSYRTVSQKSEPLEVSPQDAEKMNKALTEPSEDEDISKIPSTAFWLVHDGLSAQNAQGKY